MLKVVKHLPPQCWSQQSVHQWANCRNWLSNLVVAQDIGYIEKTEDCQHLATGNDFLPGQLSLLTPLQIWLFPPSIQPAAQQVLDRLQVLRMHFGRSMRNCSNLSIFLFLCLHSFCRSILSGQFFFQGIPPKMPKNGFGNLKKLPQIFIDISRNQGVSNPETQLHPSDQPEFCMWMFNESKILSNFRTSFTRIFLREFFGDFWWCFLLFPLVS